MFKTIGIILLATGATAFASDFDAGMKCYESRDFDCAVQSWRPLAEAGVAQAQYNLALLYTRGQGVTKDPAKAAEYFEKAADMGVVQAQYNLAQAYLLGRGVSKDEEKAISWFQKAAELGDPNAANNLGTILENRKDYGNAIEWYKKAASAGLPSAQFNIGQMYDLGRGMAPDYAQAIEWYSKAADQGDAGALCNLGILYYNGNGVKVDRAKAYTYLLLAFQAGDSRANDLLTITGEKLQPKQIAQAGESARNWEQAHPVKPSTGDVAAPEPIMNADSKVTAVSPSRAVGLD